jgi:hypothetical protein
LFIGSLRNLLDENGVSKICPSSSPASVAVRVKIQSLLGTRLAENVGKGEVVSFDVKAQMEEKDRRSGQISVGFALKVGTKPNVAKYEVEGIAMLEGKDEDIRKMLEVDPETQIPFVFQRVYQHIFMSIYLLATLIDAPYPPPNLLSSGQEMVMEPSSIGVVAPVGEKTALPPTSTSAMPQRESETQSANAPKR